jgi:hypothetical protein
MEYLIIYGIAFYMLINALQSPVVLRTPYSEKDMLRSNINYNPSAAESNYTEKLPYVINQYKGDDESTNNIVQPQDDPFTAGYLVGSHLCHPFSLYYYDERPSPGIYSEVRHAGTRCTALRAPNEFTQNEPVKREHLTKFYPLQVSQTMAYIPPFN